MKSEFNKTKNANIHSGHRQRVKDRFLRAGLDSFQMHEILEFLLFFGIPYKDTNALAHNLIDKFGSFSGVFDAPIESLKDVPGMTDNAAVLIKALPNISGVYMKDKLQNTAYLGTFSACLEYLKSLLYNAKKEEMYALLLDNEHRLISHKKLASGSVDHVTIILREIQEAIFYSNATNIIIAHNHPSGNPTPSQADVRTTRHIVDSISYIGVNLLDHIILSNDKYYSMSKNGDLDDIKKNCPSEYVSKFAENNKKWLTEE